MGLRVETVMDRAVREVNDQYLAVEDAARTYVAARRAFVAAGDRSTARPALDDAWSALVAAVDAGGRLFNG